MKHLKPGHVIEVHFLDHSMGDKDVKPVKARVIGSVDEVQDKFIRVNAWESDGEARTEYESFCILKSTIDYVILWTEGMKI